MPTPSIVLPINFLVANSPSKPSSSYVVEILEDVFSEQYGERCFKNCDIVDLTFACAGAVDALQNCCDWVRNGENRKAIVIASDIAK